MTVKPWLLAIRPKTLPAAVAPVAIGGAMAWGDGVFHGPSVCVALFSALCIQIATNLVNDYCDFKKGADTSERTGPLRVTQAGLIKPEVVLAAAIFFFALSAGGAWYLIARAGNSILAIAIASILSGILYTAGPKPLGYLGLGDLFVFVFFGPVAVGGTYFVQARDINLAVIVAGFAPGLLSMAILAVNNLRDINTDRKAGKWTLAVRYGRSFALAEFLFCILGVTIVPFMVNLITQDHQGIIIASLTGFIAIPVVRTVFTQVEGEQLNKALASTGVLLLIYSFLFSLGWILWSR